MQVYSIHLMGTARMSEDPRRGVTDSYGAFHGVPGLYLADASLFPGPTGINPMETVIALAMRNARRFSWRPDQNCDSWTAYDRRYDGVPGGRRARTCSRRCPWPGFGSWAGGSSRCRTGTSRR